MSEETIESAAAHDEGPVHRTTAHRAAARSSAARDAIRAALGGKGNAGEREHAAPAPEPAKPEPATVADEPEAPRLDLHALRLRRELAAREASHETPEGPTFEDLLDQPGQTVRGWLESMRGDKFADDGEFKGEVKDLVSRLASDVLGVQLPASVRASLDSAAARKFVKHSQATQSKRDAAARERAERAQLEKEWGRAAEALDRKLADSETYRWLATESRPGEVVVDLIRAAAEDGQTLDWPEAAKMADDFLRSEHNRRTSKLAPKKPEPAKPAPRPAASTTSGKPWSKESHKRATLAALAALKEH